MKSEEPKILYDGPLDANVPGRDARGWRWFLQGHEVLVEISETAMESRPEYLSDRVREARRTRGESELWRMLDWPVPNPHVVLTTDD